MNAKIRENKLPAKYKADENNARKSYRVERENKRSRKTSYVKSLKIMTAKKKRDEKRGKFKLDEK